MNYQKDDYSNPNSATSYSDSDNVGASWEMLADEELECIRGGGTGIGQSIRTDNGSPDGVIRNDRTLNNNQKTDSNFEGVVPVVLSKLGLQ